MKRGLVRKVEPSLMGKSDANECNESSLSNCRVQLALSTKKDGMILEKRLDDFRNQYPFSILLPLHLETSLNELVNGC